MDSVCDLPEGLLPLAEAKARLLESITPIQRAGRIPTAEAQGRILSGLMTAPLDFPPFANAAMDGYALKAAEAQPGATLSVVGTLMAGVTASGLQVRNGECVRIFTGAPIPEGADAVVVQERVETEGEGRIRLTLSEPLKPGANVRQQGEEIRKGDVLLGAGTQIGPYELGVLAFAGVTEIFVQDRLRIGILATGDELVLPGEGLASGQIYESNRPVLLGLIREMGHEAIDLGVVADDFELLRGRLTESIKGLDAVITTGGASEGDADFVSAVLRDLGTVRFWKVAVKPGKPFIFGDVRAVPVFGLPGNPVSSAIIFLKLVKPAIEALSGRKCERPIPLRLPLHRGIRRQPGRLEFMRGQLVERDGVLGVVPLPQQGSHRLTSMIQGDCLIVIPPEITCLDVGEGVDVELYKSAQGLEVAA